MKKLRNNKIRKLLAFMVALALMVSCMPSAYTISASEAFGDGTEDIFTDGEITSEPAAEESTPDVSSADQEETEQAQQSTLTYENDSVKVTAEALEDGALPQNTALKADGVNENSSVSYDTVSQKLSAAATDKGSSLRGFFAYDVYFADGDGNRVEPNGRVRVTFEYKTPAAPELTDAASTSVTVEKLHYNSSTGDTDVNTLQANEDLKVLNVNEGKQIQTLQVETGNAAVFAVMWDSPETADVEAEAVSGNEDEASIASEELTDGMDISDEPEQDAAETPAAENPEVTPDAEPSEAPAENPDAEPTEAPAENPDVVEEPAEDIASPEDVPAADENGETSLIEVLGDDTNLRVSPSIEAEVLATVNAGTQLTLLDTVTAEDGATWYKVSWEGTEAYIRSDMAQVVDSSDEAEEPEDVQEEEIQPEITRYDYTSDEVNVKVTLTDPADLPDNAELSVTPVELSQEAKDQITEEAIKEKKAIEKIHSYDIKFLVDGEEVQPGASVKVSVSLNDEKKIKDADVYHVDENDNVENMDGSVAKNGDVEFETTHFSTYVIVQKGKDNIRVKVRYCDQSGKEIYAADDKTLEVANKLKLKELANWNVTRVEVAPTSGGEHKTYTDVETPIELAEDATVTAYYEATTGTTTGDPTFFDYTVKVRTKNGMDSINNSKNYKNPNSDRKLTVGGSDTNGGYSNNYNEYTHVWWDDQNQCPNSWTGYWGDRYKTVKGLLNNVDGPNVTFNYADPGFFEQQNLPVTDQNGNKVYLRRVYKDYKLNFSRTGDTYKLSTVQDGNGERVANAGANFFPLDPVGYQPGGNQANSNVEDINEISTGGGKLHNYFFGLRYDIKFKLGDYIGDLKYKFTGDDDLWVVLDGNKVVIDLGGIHNAATGEVDLWKKLLNGRTIEQLTNEEKKAEHTLTVLYMERGAEASNCEMEFTLPNATISQVTKDPLGTLELQKVDSNEQGVNGAQFTLYEDSACTKKIGDAESETVGDVKGKVNFSSKLRKGTYYLKETRAPDGYVRSTETWTVKVEKTGEAGVSVTLEDSSGNSVENNQIVNQTQQEIIDSSMEYNKTATVKDWDQRTYDINITAASKTTSSSVVTTGGIADVVMALDVSGSMKRTQTAGNKNASYTEFGRYDKSRNSLEPNKIYYYGLYGNRWEGYYSYPMINRDNTWMYYYNNSWNNIGDSDTTKIYEWPSRITALKEVVNQFIRNTATSSSESNIGLAPFNTKVTTNATGTLLNVGTSKDDLIKKVSQLSADGGTSPHTALDEALKLLNNAKNPKYVILFTDGEPTGDSSTWKDYYQDKAEEAAKALKDKGIKVFTVGFALGDKGQKFLAGDKNDPEKYPGNASEGCAFNADNAEKLAEIFKKIQNTVTESTAIHDATITDVIDPRFVILDDAGNAITADQLKDGKTVQVNGGTVYLDAKGNQCIKWVGQTIPNKEENKQEENKSWSKSITVKAKDEYIGGNNVPTNVSPDSKISTGFGDAILPQPKVNVKSDLVVNNNETTIFYGDTVPTAEDILKVLFDKANPQGYVTQLDGKKKLVIYTMGADGRSFNENDFTLKWYEDENCTQEIKVEDMAEVGPEPNSKQYYLKVTYNSGKSDGSGVLTAHNSQKDTAREYGVYTINIITGQIQIIKKLETAAKKDVNFTFDVKKADVKIATATAAIEAGKTEGKVTLKLEDGVKEQISENDTSILTRLARGEYTVTEVPNSNYTLKELAAGTTTTGTTTNCNNEVRLADRQIKFSIGTDTAGTPVLKDGNTDTTKGTIGVAEFTNEQSVADVEIVKVDAANTNVTITGATFALYEADAEWNKTSENPFNTEDIVSGNEGRIELKDLPVGNYLLVETKAATGYSLPTKPWKITVGSGGTVKVMDNEGETVGNITKNEMTIYQITNTKLYSLPESGGPGTYGFTISGVAILATALLLFINNKRREEEAKRS
ncbi:SpaA isopeptide-forming pilin-related protein [Blautia sp.]|uniref:SpaA isopeptide-forming pilin-related protein n=1 Tax=Blautia sp. TaxID=1955243 RepID=UPI003521C0A9